MAQMWHCREIEDHSPNFPANEGPRPHKLKLSLHPLGPSVIAAYKPLKRIGERHADRENHAQNGRDGY